MNNETNNNASNDIMNNEANNNASNDINSNGMNFVQGGISNNNGFVNNGNVTQTPINQIPQPVEQGNVGNAAPIANAVESQIMSQNITSPEVPMAGTPQVTPQSVGQMPVNFMSTDMQQQSVPMSNQIPQEMVTNQTVAPFGQQSIPSVMQQQVQTPVMPMQSQSMMQPMMGGVPPQVPIMSILMQTSTDVNDTMASKKTKTPILMIIITILVVVGVAVFLVLYLTGKINFGASNTNNQGNGNTAEEINNQEDNVLMSWMNYLLDQNITEIRLSRYTENDGSISNDALSNPTVVTLNTEQLENIFANMTSYNLIKYYSSGSVIDTTDELKVTYTSGDNSLVFMISGGRISFDNNGNLLELFENSEHIIQDDGETSRDSDNYSFILENFDSDFYDEYFVSQNGENVQNTLE